MATSNYERVGKALELLRDGLSSFVVREMKSRYGERWFEEARQSATGVQASNLGTEDRPQWDAAALLAILINQWNAVFSGPLGRVEKTLAHELKEIRNGWAHQKTFSSDDCYRALDSAARLLTAISATPQADEIERSKMELLRVRFDEQARSERRKTAKSSIESDVTGSLKPWREVVTPHKDVASGRYQQAEFAADLWQVHLGEGTDEYRTPSEFFRRTYLTDSLKRLLSGALRRLSGKGGDPVVQLQTNFGGGKTHSMLALYHLFSGAPAGELAGVDAVLNDAEVHKIPTAVKRVVFVGNKVSPGNPVVKQDGSVVRTLWGELVWQLGGKRAFRRILADDEKGTNPGDVLRELFNEHGPCLLLIDEWVAYARQLHDMGDLPAGSFETQFTFAQALTEAARLSKKCLLVVSLPASDASGSPHAMADDAEVGGERGRAALERLRNVIGRVESSWRPASAEEGFEIVRRRLFEPLVDQAQFVSRDSVARAFFDMYRTQQDEFPADSRDSDYEKRLRAAYPIHPEVFDRLYSDWSTMAKFQRTRGVLRLMAAVIHSLWQKEDRNPLIMPANIPIEEPRVQFELTRYLSDNWVPVIEKDVDGPNALPFRMDSEVSTLGKFAACRRVARTIYLGSAPIAAAANRGLEDRRVKLGCVMPGESPGIFGDALRRLSASATYLYQDGPRYWFATQATVTKLADERAEELKRDPDKVRAELEKRLHSDLKKQGDFSRIHAMPQSGYEVPDDMAARLVVLDSEHPYTREPGNAAETKARSILESRGTAPRLYQNTLIFLAADQARLQDLDEALRRYLAWHGILADRERLDLSPHQVKQAETQRDAADRTVASRLPETYFWLLIPCQAAPDQPISWQAVRLAGGSDGLAPRASARLRKEEFLIANFAGTSLRHELDRIPLWRGERLDCVSVRQLAEDFARYVYLPRLLSLHVLARAVADGVSLLTWDRESFAYSDARESPSEIKPARFLGLRAGQNVAVAPDGPGIVVKSEVARLQMEADEAERAATQTGGDPPTTSPGALPAAGPAGVANPAKAIADAPRLTRFHGTVALQPDRVGRDAGRIADEVLSHLVALLGADVSVTLEIAARVPMGAPDHVVRIVTENARTLRFTSQGFETE